MTAFLAATVGGACGSASTRAAAPKGDDPHPVGSDHGARSRDHEHAHHGFADADAWAKVFDDPARDTWQHPADVLSALELAPTMTVADVGAGTGYFAVRLARAVPEGEVIATDVEPDMVRFVNERARREQLPNLRAVRATPAASGLAARSVDRILVVHVWHHLADRVAYARDLAAALRPGGKLFVVDFSLTARRGPPMNMRLGPDAVVADLVVAGMVAKLSPVSLPDQYLVEAHRP
ncbi:MAG: class I SAM-dependent methyltransferase [Labilithrix sp.]|nr:class I SAM-dependent methyltransferase [Labilithrix sp.]